MTEMSVATRPVTKPRMSETRVPTTTCVKTSCPVCVVPSQCVADGGERISVLNALGSFVRIIGPKIATSVKNMRMPRPKLTLRFTVTIRQRSLRRCILGVVKLSSGEGILTSCEGRLMTVNSFPGAHEDRVQHITYLPESSLPARRWQ